MLSRIKIDKAKILSDQDFSDKAINSFHKNVRSASNFLLKTINCFVIVVNSQQLFNAICAFLRNIFVQRFFVASKAVFEVRIKHKFIESESESESICCIWHHHLTFSFELSLFLSVESFYLSINGMYLNICFTWHVSLKRNRSFQFRLLFQSGF